MKILFISFAAVSLRDENIRPFAMLKALADAGHQVDLLALSTDIPVHPNIRILPHGEGGRPKRLLLKLAILRAASRRTYDVVHAVDDAVLFAARCLFRRKRRLVYDAMRRFSGPAAAPAGGSRRWKWFPSHGQKREALALKRADLVFSTCSALTDDLLALNREARIEQVEDIPVQSLYTLGETSQSRLLEQFTRRPGCIVVCSCQPGFQGGFRNLLLAARKVVDVVPSAAFVFKGAADRHASDMAANLEISGQCVFVAPKDMELWLSALRMAAAALLAPSDNGRYIPPQVYTLLHAGVPVVAVHEDSCDGLLNAGNSVQVPFSAESIAEGLLRVIQEPLLSFSLAHEGQRLVADRHTFSSFKHKVRLAYHTLGKIDR